jgi:hypothetical protein
MRIIGRLLQADICTDNARTGLPRLKRVAPGARVALLDRERAEPAEFNPLAARERRGDLVENCGDDHFDISGQQMRIGGG